jgi:hypothetical protein
MTFIFILFIFLVAIFIVYFDYILSIVSLSLYLCISSYNVHPNKVPWVGGRDYVSVVLICYLSANKSFVVHSPNIGHRSRVRLRRKGEDSILKLP